MKRRGWEMRRGHGVGVDSVERDGMYTRIYSSICVTLRVSQCLTVAGACVTSCQ
jgi:hypothetical protein